MGKEPTFTLSLIFWPNTKDIATSASFSLLPPSLLPLAPSSSFSCFWTGKKNKASTRVYLYFLSCLLCVTVFPVVFFFPVHCSNIPSKLCFLCSMQLAGGKTKGILPQTPANVSMFGDVTLCSPTYGTLHGIASWFKKQHTVTKYTCLPDPPNKVNESFKADLHFIKA